MNGIPLILVASLFTQQAQQTPSERAFERFTQMGGMWSGAADDGRKINERWQVIAGGSVVMYESDFEAHPNEKMVTMFHLDSGRLLLTHYCVAKNQPRLIASEFSEDGNKITFTFLDGTNLKNRDQGHMDKVIWEFPDKDTMSSQWTWYANGKESWMEKFTIKRAGELVASTSGGGATCCSGGR